MKKLTVRYDLDGARHFEVGTLAEDSGRLFFEYAPSFIERGVELSPFFLPLRTGLIEHTDRSFGPLWGLFDDSLPDGWGLLLMERRFRERGISLRSLSPLDLLAFLGTQTMGTLTYHPPLEKDPAVGRTIDLDEAAVESLKILNGEPSDILPQLLAAGGSPGGARPKVLVGYDPRKKRLLSGGDVLPKGYRYWMVKFRSKEDPADSAEIEYAYALMARAAGIELPEVRLFDGGNGRRYFGVERFDRGEGGRRYHLHTFGGLVHADFRVPSVDYRELLKVTALLTKDHTAVREMFRRMVFNVAAHNRDDHVKNFSFLCDIEKERWRVSSAYDLTFAEGPGGEHSMTVDGVGRAPDIGNIMAVAQSGGIDQKAARKIVAEVAGAVAEWERFADEAGVTPDSASRIAAKLALHLID